jgi:putative ABC transport system permease protein
MILWRRLQYLLPWKRRAAERDMQEELRSIAAMAQPGELGNLTIAAEDARAEWGWTRLEQTAQDVRYAVHSLRKSPVFAATAVLSLAIGVGANVAVFTLLDTIMWRSLPVREPERLLILGVQSPTGLSNGFTYQQYELVRDHVPALDVAAYAPLRLNVSIDGRMEPPIDGQLVTGDYFPMLGVRPALGRLLGPDDDRVPLGHPVVVLSDRYWKRRFNSDPGVVGRAVVLSGTPFTIVGVAPAEFFGTEIGMAPSLFAPIMMQPAVMPMTVNLLRDPIVMSAWVRVLARLDPNASHEVAIAQLDALTRTEETDWRPRNKFTGERVDAHLVLTSAATGFSYLRRQFSEPLFLLLGIAGVVLLVACANVGNLILARAATRRSEFALRLALGASRLRLVRQILVEALVLAALAAPASIALAMWATRTLVAYAAAGQSPIAVDLSPDARMLAFTAALTMCAGVLLGAVPAIRASRSAISGDPRRDLVRVSGAGTGPGRLLVVAQVALSLVLVVGAALFARTLQNLTGPDAAVDRTQVLVVRVEPRGSGDRHQPGRADQFDRMYQDLMAEVGRIPGVRSVSLARSSPLSQRELAFLVVPPDGRGQRVPSQIIYPGYFSTMGIPLVTGRDFNRDDLRSGAPPAVIVNEAFVRQFLNGQTPLGTAHGVAEARARSNEAGAPLNIIGVVKDSKFPDIRSATGPTVYQTFLQARTGFAHMVLHVRTDRVDAGIIDRVRQLVQAIDPVVPLADIHSLADEVNGAVMRERLVATLSGVFGVIALALACIGLYGLLAFSVSNRTAEIGLRVALGAAPADVRRMVLRQAMGIVLAGLAIGLPTAWMCGRLASRQLAGLLFGLTSTDPATIATAVAALIAVAAAAGTLPARRAARIDPIVALRAE